MDGTTSGPVTGEKMSDADALVSSPGLAVLMREELIARVAPVEELAEEFAPGLSTDSIAEMCDGVVREFSINGVAVTHAGGNAVIPGLIDAHTHLLWAGDRSSEVRMRQQGASYAEIAAAGGGIAHTVGRTRDSSQQSLLSSGVSRMREALANGTTSMEAKSGYGLDTPTELALLETMGVLASDRSLPSLDITWMGAHDAPPGQGEKSSRLADYVEELLSEQLPAVSEQGLARSCDVFCEPGWFTTEQTSDVIMAAAEAGLSGRLHIDEFADGDGARLAAELDVETADHALVSSEKGRAALGESKCNQGFLLGAPHTMGMQRFPPIQQAIDREWAWTLATDFNPNCRILSLPMIASLAVQRCAIDPLAALCAVTCNAAETVREHAGRQHGRITEGAVASLNILNGPKWEGWCLQPGSSPFSSTLLRGSTVIH